MSNRRKIGKCVAIAGAALMSLASSAHAAVIFQSGVAFPTTKMSESKATNVTMGFGTVFNKNDVKVTSPTNIDLGAGFALITQSKNAGLFSQVTFTPQTGRFFGIQFRVADVVANTNVVVTIQDNQGDPAQTFTFPVVKANQDTGAMGIFTNIRNKTIKFVQIQNGSGFLRVKQVEWLGSGSNTPEPASWALMVIGLGGLGGALRRRRQATV